MNKIDKNSRLICERLALAYLRKGELENCVANHSAESCILPIGEGGLHSMPNGSREAIRVYSKIIEKLPEDYTSIWLLNIAYMTLGEYPDQVPPKWLVPNLLANDNGTIIPFKNIATGTGLDVNDISGGSSVEDFNNDGYLDVMASLF